MSEKHSRVTFLSEESLTSNGKGCSKTNEEGGLEDALNVIMDENATEAHALAVTRGADGEALPKHLRSSNGPPTTLRHLLNPYCGESQKEVKRKRFKAETGRRKNVSSKLRTVTVDRPGRYDVVSALTSAQAVLIFGQLWQGEATGARNELDP